MYNTAIKILKRLNNLGYQAYIVGGFPRDLLLNIESNDIDICTSATTDEIKKLFDVVQDNSRFGSLKIKQDNHIYEITTLRIDLEYNGRYPKISYTNSLKEDLKRRDFTINTICIDKDKNIIDYLNGRNDINKKIIKSVGNSDKKIKEDPIRILRAIRLSGKLNFDLEDNLKNSIIKYSYLLKDISKNNKKKEIDKMNEISLKILKKLKIEEYI